MLFRIRRKLSGFSELKRIYVGMLRFFPVHISYAVNRYLRSPYSKIEDDNSVIFVHIPKAAGNAVMKSLFGKPATGHDPLIRYAENDICKFKKYYKIAVVRNPWDRMVSSFHYLKQGGIGFFDIDFRDKYLNEIHGFDCFLKKMMSDREFERSVVSWVHFVPQKDFLVDFDGKVGVDRLVKLESLDCEFESICSELGVSGKILIRDNSSSRKDYRSYYTEETKNYIGRVYASDIDILDYEF